jgi:hypothetical protein
MRKKIENMKGSSILFLLIGGGIVYYFMNMEDDAPKEVIDPKDVSKWDDKKINDYLQECCESKKKGILLGTHEKPEFMAQAKKEARKRGLQIPKCAQSSIDFIDQSFVCPKCFKAPCKCRKIGINDMVKDVTPPATGAMPKCEEGTAFINGRCLPLPNRKPKQNRRIGKQFPPSDSYAFPNYINPQGQGYTLQNG